MKPFCTAALAALALLTCATMTLAQPVPTDEETDVLTIGSKAPALSIGEWVKGDAVEQFKPGQVYVVEFWATWCPPCRASMPHLSKLQSEYKGKVTFIGISDEDNETVTGFMAEDAPADPQAEGDAEEEAKTWDQVVTYTIALDKEEGTSAAYMEAAGQSGIPTAFVVGKDGVIDWIGHPMQIDEPLAAIVDGTWDREAARQKIIEEQRAEKAMQVAMGELREAVGNEDYDKAVAVVDGLIKEFPDNQQFPMLRLQVLRMSGDTEKFKAGLDAVAQSHWDDAAFLNQLAWGIAAQDNDPNRPLDVVKKMAERAAELTEHKDGSILDTLARVHYEMGDLEKAIELQKKAVAAGGPMVDDLKSTLQEYQAEKDGDSDETEAEEGDDK